MVFVLGIGFLISHWVPLMYPLIWSLAALLAILLIWDGIALYNSHIVSAERILPEKFSNGDENPVLVIIRNKAAFNLYIEVIDEVPVQFQKRDFLKSLKVGAKNEASFTYTLYPVERGEYVFGNLNLYSSSRLKLIKRRDKFQQKQQVKVYPSFIQMKKYDFLAVKSRINQSGLKKMRKIGHTMEFEQIKEYVLGDDIRTLNWKATAKRGDLMVNQFQDEKSQPVYSLIDRSRVMKMPYNNLKLLDYSINSSLAFSNIALKRKDKVGMFSFSNTVENFIPSRSKTSQLSIIQENLYNINNNFLDADFGLLYAHTKRFLPQRSLLLLYTNFEHLDGLRRQLPYLSAISKKHLLVVIFFENETLEKITTGPAETIPEIFDQTIAEQFLYEKKVMVRELEKHRIQALLTKPEELSINTINKYLEIKARGLL